MGGSSGIRDTSAQDAPIDPAPARRRRLRILIASGAGAVLLIASSLPAFMRWMDAEISVPRERVRIAEVTRGPFVRDVSAQGTVVAAVSPTLFAPAAGNVTYCVQAGDIVKRGQVLGTVDSPELRNELAREQATLAGLEVAVQRQSIETRRRAAHQPADHATSPKSTSRRPSASSSAPRMPGRRRPSASATSRRRATT